MKKISIFIFLLLVISLGFCNSAFGATNDMVEAQININKTNVQANVDIAKILAEVDRVNLQIQDLVDKAVSKALEINVKEANDISKLESEKTILQADSNKLKEHPEELAKITDKINDCKQEANYAIIKIMENLINVTDIIANNMIDEAAKYGIIVTKEYVPITVNGAVYSVDPLHVS